MTEQVSSNTQATPSTFSVEAWERAAVEHFKALLQIPTINPPGNERPAADYLAKVLQEQGIASQIFESAPQRANLVARLDGDGSAKPLLLAGHTDVVPVDREYWKHDPFGAVEDEGHIWARGALDMKNMVTMSMMVLLRLKAEGVRLARDVIFCAVADEEEGCRYGSRFMVEEHPDLVRAEYMIGEVGGFTMYVNGTTLYPIQVAEKGRVKLRMIARGEPGHGSMPKRDSAVIKLAEAITKVGKARLPQHNTPIVESFLSTLADTQKLPVGVILKLLSQPQVSNLLLERVIPKTLAGTFYALLHNTVSPTMLEGSIKLNVIPSEATCLLDGRLLPGFSGADLVRELKAVTGDSVEYIIDEEAPAVVNPYHTDLYRLIERKIRQHDNAGVPIPYMIPGFTDACQFSRLGTVCYGFSPLQLPKDADYTFTQLFHGHNERVPVDGYLWGLRVLYDTVKTFCEAA
ncbi:MAG: M20/M25/M40 family metallo-hydrolase [Myxococcales bacterium]|nr:M20/M25/M40 family metallo-hydrolase [Myxococcales bacterium]MCB9642389.1 M20/M25/M40 family metallo-hydrolase [Myxococcales bacterium]